MAQTTNDTALAWQSSEPKKRTRSTSDPEPVDMQRTKKSRKDEREETRARRLQDGECLCGGKVQELKCGCGLGDGRQR